MTDLEVEDEAWDFWEAAGIHCGGYNSGVDRDMLNVLKLISDDEYMFCDTIAERLGLSVQHVELIQYIFCSMGWCDYGTSPRGCFMPADKKHHVAELEAYIDRQWGNTDD